MRPKTFATFASGSAIVFASFTATAGERVEHPTAALSWVRAIDAERCVGAIGLEEDLKARVGYDPFVAARPVDRQLSGFITRSSAARGGFEAEIVVRDEAGAILGSRKLRSAEADCRSLGEAVAVTMALALEPFTRDTTARDPFASAPAEAPPSPPAARAATAPRATTSRATIVASGSTGLVPGPALGIGLRVLGRVHDRLELGVSARYLPERAAEGGLSFALASGAVEGCVVPWLGAGMLSVTRWCAAVHGGAFHVFVAPGALSPLEVGTFPWLGAETGPSVTIPLFGALRLDAGIAVVVPIVRRQAFLRGESAPVWEQATVGGVAEIGVGASL